VHQRLERLEQMLLMHEEVTSTNEVVKHTHAACFHDAVTVLSVAIDDLLQPVIARLAQTVLPMDR
jgi:hypothetical protein